MAFETIQIDQEARVGIITLNRPKALNALNSLMVTEIGQAVSDFDKDDEIGAILVTGSDKAFAAGADIKEMKDKTFLEMTKEDLFESMMYVQNAKKPIIGAVSGYALGGGCELALLCDILIAEENAKFGLPEISLGIIPGIGGTQRMVRAIGKAKAMEMILTGRMMTAEEAESSGLVSRVVEKEELYVEALKTASTIAQMSAPVVQMAKEAVNRAFEMSLSDGLIFEKRLFQSTFSLEDQKEGMEAFVEKRTPNFMHR